jgi:aldehyde dehydrogenase (NAD+)
VLERHGWKGVLNLVIGKDDVVGERLIGDPRVPLISATGSCRMGRVVAETVAARLGRTLLELGGNNGVIVMDDADPDLVVRAVLFGAVGTAGQRCTSIRRFSCNASRPKMTEKLIAAYRQVRSGIRCEPRNADGTADRCDAVDEHDARARRIAQQGGDGALRRRERAGRLLRRADAGARIPDMPILKEEIFAPILYLIEFDQNRRSDRSGTTMCRRGCRRRSSPPT